MEKYKITCYFYLIIWLLFSKCVSIFQSNMGAFLSLPLNVFYMPIVNCLLKFSITPTNNIFFFFFHDCKIDLDTYF